MRKDNAQKRLIVWIFWLVVCLAAQPVLAARPALTPPPPLPSSFWGSVRYAEEYDASVSVTAWIDETEVAQGQIQMYEGVPYYAIDIRGDDPETPEREGGVEGDVIIYKLNSSKTHESGVWHSGTNVRLDLSAEPTAVRLAQFSARPTSPTGWGLALAGILALGLVWRLGWRKLSR